jgi:hypothetical protein
MNGLGKVAASLLIAAGLGAVCSCSAREVAHGAGQKAPEPATGAIGLSLQPVSGVTLTTLHFVITKAGVASPVLEGDIAAPGTAKTITLGLPVPVGTGYTLSLTGVSVENPSVTCTGTFGVFDVVANASTSLNLLLFCADQSQGSVFNRITAQTDACPRLLVKYVVATPNSAALPGGTIALSGSAIDLDGKPIQYSWQASSAGVGSFAPSNASATTFSCLSAGTNLDVTLTANNGECGTSLSTSISCAGVTCGNGVLDPNEACDPSIPSGQPGFGPCLPNCELAVCGNGIVESPVEQCDPVPPDPNNCSTTCQTVIPECGDGRLSRGESCDGTLFPPGTPQGASCSSDCSNIFFSVDCGDGIVEGGEKCDPPFTRNDCGADCESITPTACFTCENDPSTCSDFVNCDMAVGNAAVGSPAAGTPKAQLCNSVLDCVRDTGCAADAASIRCYCGTVNAAECLGGLGNGKCRTQIEAGLETTTPATVVQRLQNVQFGGGLALARIDCDQTFCPSECGL